MGTIQEMFSLSTVWDFLRGKVKDEVKGDVKGVDDLRVRERASTLAAAKETNRNLPTLQESKRQCEWAECLRAHMVREAEYEFACKLREASEQGLDGDTWTRFMNGSADIRRAYEELLLNPHAPWWIDNRGRKLYTIAGAMAYDRHMRERLSAKPRTEVSEEVEYQDLWRGWYMGQYPGVLLRVIHIHGSQVLSV